MNFSCAACFNPCCRHPSPLPSPPSGSSPPAPCTLPLRPLPSPRFRFSPRAFRPLSRPTRPLASPSPHSTVCPGPLPQNIGGAPQFRLLRQLQPAVEPDRQRKLRRDGADLGREDGEGVEEAPRALRPGHFGALQPRRYGREETRARRDAGEETPEKRQREATERSERVERRAERGSMREDEQKTDQRHSLFLASVLCVLCVLCCCLWFEVAIYPCLPQPHTY